ncbi:MAG: pyridoxamine 5'-phosphate oxidase family protein [Candidatus Omnitrophica bacterium]|nr:pyridoxamine 5'-phosphate oxidase family protein [Candidatus Omnitrophota bacterium]
MAHRTKEEEMDRVSSREVIVTAEGARHIFVTSADKEGRPHLAAAEKVSLDHRGLLAIELWPCPATLRNAQENKHVSLIIWDAERDSGYQLSGEVEGVQEDAFLDGYIPQAGKINPPPRVKRMLLIRVEQVVEFTRAPHSDSLASFQITHDGGLQ